MSVSSYRFVVPLGLAVLALAPGCAQRDRPMAAASQPAAPAAAAEVVMTALTLIGVPYRLGGDDPATGLDCSGLVRHVFGASGGIDLPRRSEQMAQLGRPVARALLQPGDLVFFDTLGRANSHVGIYVGDGGFVHAPAQRGRVRTESLEAPFWLTRYQGARRLIEEPPGAVAPSAR